MILKDIKLIQYSYNDFNFTLKSFLKLKFFTSSSGYFVISNSNYSMVFKSMLFFSGSLKQKSPISFGDKF